MCRHLAHLGPTPVTVSSLVTEPSHSLLAQSYAPVDMRGGTVNVDGFGVGWWPQGAAERQSGGAAAPRPEPYRYRASVPIWTDGSFLELAGTWRSSAVVAAIRAATPGMTVSTAACAPFAGEGWLFSHNGYVPGWPDSMVDLAATLPVRDLLTLDAATDAALLWALVRARIRDGVDPAEALRDVVARTLALAPDARLNLLLCDGTTVLATAVAHALSLREGPDGVTVASEPLDDDPAWTPVPDGHLVHAAGRTTTVTPLG